VLDIVGPLYLVLSLVELVLVVWALVDSLLHKPAAYVAAGKLTKTKWNAILGVALLFVLLSLTSSPAAITGLAAVIAASVYLADVRPAVREYRGRGGGGGGRMGPYGPW
jgi:Protein of unknown function (DUF2516)